MKRFRIDSQQGLAYVDQLGSLAVSGALTIALPLLLGARTYGEFAVAVGLSYVAVGFFDQGFNLAAIRAGALSPGRWNQRAYETAFRSKLFIALIPAATIVLVSPLLDQVYAFEGGVVVFVLAAFLVPVLSQFAFMYQVLLAVARNVLTVSTRLIVAVVLLGLTLLIGVTWRMTATTAIGIVLVAFGVGALRLWRSTGRPKLGAELDTATLRSNRDYVWLMAITGVFSFLASGTVPIAGAFLTAEEAGNLRLSLSLAAAIAVLIPVPGTLLFARFSAMTEHSNAGAELRRSLITGLVGGTVLAFALKVVGPTLIVTIFRRDFGAAADLLNITWAIAPLQALEVPLLGAALTAPHAALLGRALIAAGVLDAVVIVTLSARFGASGAAAATLLGHAVVVAVLLAVAVGLRQEDRREDWR